MSFISQLQPPLSKLSTLHLPTLLADISPSEQKEFLELVEDYSQAKGETLKDYSEEVNVLLFCLIFGYEAGKLEAKTNAKPSGW